MDRLYYDINEQFESFEKWRYILIGKNGTLSNLTSYLLDNNTANKLYCNELKKIMFNLNCITDTFNEYQC